MKKPLIRLSLSQQFMLLSFPILLAGTLFIGRWIGLQVQESVVHRLGGVTALYVDSFIAPRVQGLLGTADLTSRERTSLSQLLESTALGSKIVLLRIWRPDGTVVYSSSDSSSVGQKLPIEESLAASLRGEIVSEISDRSGAQQALHGQPLPRVIETYTPIHADNLGKVIAAAEFYQAPDEVDREVSAAQRQSWLVFAATMLTMYLCLFLVVRRGSRTIERQQQDLSDKVAQLTAVNSQNRVLHERVKRAAERATALNERFLQRLSADLHDGPGQDLGFALMQLNSTRSCDQGCDQHTCMASTLKPVRVAVQAAMDDLRAISADLQLPDIEHLSLSELAARAVRDYETKTASMVEIDCDVPAIEAPVRIKIALCRVLQESLANAFRHAHGKETRVVLRAQAGNLILVVQDQGPGFDVAGASAKGRFGLVGMRERVEVVGGTFNIESVQGRGTTIRAVLPVRAQEAADG